MGQCARCGAEMDMGEAICPRCGHDAVPGPTPARGVQGVQIQVPASVPSRARGTGSNNPVDVPRLARGTVNNIAALGKASLWTSLAGAVVPGCLAVLLALCYLAALQFSSSGGDADHWASAA